jgi:hypothetical protein
VILLFSTNNNNDNNNNNKSKETMTITTYHCICTEVAIATKSSLTELPKRRHDGAFICNMEGACTLNSAVSVENTPSILKLEDGFEKRYAVKCARCELLFAYQLDVCHFEETKSETGRRKDVVYVLPGGLMTTEEMLEGRRMDGEIEIKVGSGA